MNTEETKEVKKEIYTGNIFNNPRFAAANMSKETIAEYKRYGEQMYSFNYETGMQDPPKKKKTTKQKLREKILKNSKESKETEPDPIIDSVANIISYVKSGYPIEDLSKEEQDLLKSHYGGGWKKIIEDELNKEYS